MEITEMLRRPSLKHFCRWGRKQKIIILIIGISGLFLYYHYIVRYVIGPQLWTNHLKDQKFLGSDKCPACFGTSLCEDFWDEKIHMTSYSRFRFFDFVNIKNVYEGTHNDNNVILKRLGHNAEFKNFDKTICESAGLPEGCNVAKVIHRSHLSKLNDKNGLTPDDVRGLSDLVHCPSQRLLDQIWHAFHDLQGQIEGTISTDNKIMLMSILTFNPEPLTTQIFKQVAGWPFPQFIGACGRFVVFDNVGKTLLYYYHSPWQTRIDYAYQVFAIAEMFTNNEEEYALYMTDVTYENFAVNQKNEVLLVDVENVIVVDKKQIRQDKPPKWDEKLESMHDECEHSNCLSFSVSDLCSRVEADHNYYAVCHGLLWTEASIPDKPNGLLHDIPESVKESAELVKLLEECQNPSEKYGRFNAAPQLLLLLQKLSKRI